MCIKRSKQIRDLKHRNKKKTEQNKKTLNNLRMMKARNKHKKYKEVLKMLLV